MDALRPLHAGPNSLNVYAYDVSGNTSAVPNHVFCVPPGSKGDTPGDTSGDGLPDILQVSAGGNLWTCVGLPEGDLDKCLAASHTSDKKLHQACH
ncbi:hypothetical protein ACWD5R_28035 [Streptomyces sp. NPDC002514]|uniref:hypothetical protein n=1 Tax=Streptomyces sp. NPDC001270 TaxID=3364554 RepID=UPI0036A64AF2